MRAVVSDSAISVVERPTPELRAGFCLVRMRLAGLADPSCESALCSPGRSVILGSQCVGIVERGSAAWVGQRAAIDPTIVCRRCNFCSSGMSSHCCKRQTMGIDLDGCFAEWVAAPEANLIALPESLSDEKAAFLVPLSQACHAIAMGCLSPRHRVCIVGAGVVGVLCAQVIREREIKHIALDGRSTALAVCEKLGIECRDVHDGVERDLYDVAIDTGELVDGLSIATQRVRPRGSIVVRCGPSAKSVDLRSAVTKEIRIFGSRDGSLTEACAMLARNAVDVSFLVSHVMRLSEAAKAFELARQPHSFKVLLKPG